MLSRAKNCPESPESGASNLYSMTVCYLIYSVEFIGLGVSGIKIQLLCDTSLI